MKTPHKHAEDNSANKKKPHIHAELIKQWADGAEIQFEANGTWYACAYQPEWTPSTHYRVKPEPNPDVVKYAQIIKRDDHVEAAGNLFTTSPWGKDNLMVVFDGETGELKDVQILAKE